MNYPDPKTQTPDAVFHVWMVALNIKMHVYLHWNSQWRQETRKRFQVKETEYNGVKD